MSEPLNVQDEIAELKVQIDLLANAIRALTDALDYANVAGRLMGEIVPEIGKYVEEVLLRLNMHDQAQALGNFVHKQHMAAIHSMKDKDLVTLLQRSGLKPFVVDENTTEEDFIGYIKERGA